MSRVLAVDPGEARLGLAVSDPTGLIARPLRVLSHVTRQLDARKIAEIAADQDAELIVVGVPLDEDGHVGPQARKAIRLIESLRVETILPVEAWDESESTLKATSIEGHKHHLDARAAAVILQEYLDARRG